MNPRSSVTAACFAIALAAISTGRAALPQQSSKPQEKQQNKDAAGGSTHDMSGMDHDMTGMGMDQNVDDSGRHAEHGALSEMSRKHHQRMGPHMHMTARRPASPEDWARGDSLALQIRESIDKYKDYREAIADGYRIFLPNLPQPEYHFTNYWNGFLESFSFDPARPTSLLYRKTKTTYELVGAMYTMPRKATEFQLNARVPLSIAQWHLHTNLCMPPRGQGLRADWTKFGLQGSLATQQACTEAGGRFYPVVFGWMMHVYPFESTREKVWAQ